MMTNKIFKKPLLIHLSVKFLPRQIFNVRIVYITAQDLSRQKYNIIES